MKIAAPIKSILDGLIAGTIYLALVPLVFPLAADGLQFILALLSELVHTTYCGNVLSATCKYVEG